MTVSISSFISFERVTISFVSLFPNPSVWFFVLLLDRLIFPIYESFDSFWIMFLFLWLWLQFSIHSKLAIVFFPYIRIFTSDFGQCSPNFMLNSESLWKDSARSWTGRINYDWWFGFSILFLVVVSLCFWVCRLQRRGWLMLKLSDVDCCYIIAVKFFIVISSLDSWFVCKQYSHMKIDGIFVRILWWLWLVLLLWVPIYG